MPTSAQVPGGTVSHLQGRANVIPADGKQPRPLQEGDTIAPGDVIHAEQGTEIQIRDGAGQDWLPSDMQVAMAGVDQGTRQSGGKGHKGPKSAAKHGDDQQNVEEAIRGLNEGKEDDATAAGLGAGGSGSLGLGLRVDRVIEAVSPQEFTYDTAVRDTGSPFTVTAAPSLDEPAQGNRSPIINDPTNPNFKPTTGRYEVQTEEDKPVSGVVRATDPDGDALTYVKGSDPLHGSVTISPDGSWTYTPNKDYNGADSFTVTVSDGKGGVVTAVVDIGITPVNDPPKIGDPGDETFDPVAGKYVVSTDEDTPVAGRVGASDVDGDALSYAPGQGPQHGTVVIQADGSWIYTPDRDYNGGDSFTVLVSDGKGGLATAVVEIGVQPVNDAPKVVGPDDDGSFDPVKLQYLADTLEDTPVSGQVTATDADGDALTYTRATAPQHGSVVVNTDGTWTYTPNADYTGFDEFTVKVDDGHGGTAIASVKVGVAPDNDPPKIDDPENLDYDPIAGKYLVSTDEDTPVSGQVRATDGDGDALSYGPGVAPVHGTVVVNADGTWTYTPDKDYNGADSFTITVSDGQGGTASALVEVGIQAVNDAPKVVDPDSEDFNPITGQYTVSTDEDTPVSGQVKATDVDGDALNYSLAGTPQHGVVAVNADGTWTYTPFADYTGSDVFTVKVDDGHGGTALATVNIGVGASNDPPKIDDPENPDYDPIASKYVVSTDEDTPVSGRVTATDSDGDALTYAPGLVPAHGAVVVNADGTWTYTPAKDYNGPDSFTVTVSDGKGGLATATIEVGVQAVNDAPKVVDPNSEDFDPITGQYTVNTDEDTPVSGQVKATDVDGDALSFTLGNAPQHGSVTVNADGTWTYTPAADYAGNDVFTVKVDDGHGGTALATVNIGVGESNDPPQINDPEDGSYDPETGKYTVSTDEDTPVSGRVSASDADGDALTYAPGLVPAHGTAVVNADGTWTYTPAKDYNGPDSFTVTVSDGKGGIAIATIDVGIQAVNDAPKVVDPDSEDFDPITGQYTVNTEEDTPVSGQVKATDVDGDALSYTLGNAPQHGNVTVNADGIWTYTPSKDYNGSDVFTVKVDDGHGGTALATVNIGIGESNDPPKIDDPENPDYDPIAGKYVVSTDEDTPVSGRVTATDSDGDALTYAPGLVPAHGTVVVNADGTWTYTPAKDYNGPDSFTVTVSDGKGGLATATIEVGVQAVNDAPKVVDPNSEDFDPITGQYTVNTDEDTPVSGQVKATDVDGDALSYSLAGMPQHGAVVVNADGTWTYTPAADYAGTDVFTVKVDDGHGGTALATVNIGVGESNDPPKIDDPEDGSYDPETGKYTIATDEDTPVSGRVSATDSDGDALTFAAGQTPTHGTVVVNSDGTWTYTPAKDYNGPDSFTVAVADGKGGTATATIEVGIQAVNDAPVVADDSQDFDTLTGQYTVNTEEDTPVSGQVKATDVDGDALSYTLGTGPQHGSVTVNADGSWTYTPGANYSGNDLFTVKVDDGHGGTAIATVNVGVGASNDPPVLVDPEDGNYDPSTGQYKVVTEEDKPVSGKIAASDADGDPLTFSAGQQPAHGTVVVNADGTWTYTPAKDYNGSDVFTVKVDDGHGGIATATVSVGITPVNDAPVIVVPANPATLSEEGLAGGNADNQGSSDTGDAKVAEGQITVSDVEGSAVSLSLSGPNGLTSGGVAVTWSGNGTAANPLIGSAGGKPVLTATIDAQGHYKLTLQGPVDHADTTKEDVRGINLQVNANDGNKTTSATLTVNVEDDSPLSGTQVMKVDATTGSQNTNLMLIIDTSGSMKEELADKTVNGIKAAIKALIDKYDDIGDVKIQIVTFSDAAQGRATWLTVAQAKTFVDALKSADGTNYDAALAAARASFSSPGKLADGVNVSYFITDGQPTRGKGLDSNDEASWEKFVTDNRIDSHAIGTGTLTSQHISNIQPIAYDGIDRTEKPAVTLTNNKDLSHYLLDTVPTVKSGSIASLAGADGLHTIEAFGSSKQVSSSLDSGTKVLTLTLQSGAEIKLNTLTGEFTMKQGRDGGDETFSYTIVDKDGDRSSGTLLISGTGTPEVPAVNHAPVVFAVNAGHNILDLVDLSVNPLLDLSKEQRVAVQDSDNNLVRVDVSVDQLLSIGSLLGDKSELHVSHDDTLTHGLKISGDGTRHLVIESETAGGTIDVAQVNKVLATLSYDPASIFGIVSVDLFPKLTIKAIDSAGASDSKSISSSIIAIDVDVPLLSSSSLKASVDGHSDGDVFAWTLADAPSSGGTHHVDTISDFNGASPTSGGDVLDLRDLLHVDSGANAGANSVDKLLNFLDFDTQSQPGSTVIHVSANGSFQADTVHGDSSSVGVADQQHIVLSNVDIRASLGLDAQANDHQIIAELVQRGKLLVDNC